MQSSLLFVCITFIGVTSRLFRINEPRYVCWDETHFGKMAGFYINRTMFACVHPPLGKLIIATIGLAGGYDGHFSFTQPGDTYYTENGTLLTPYITMRVGCAIFGTLMISAVYCIIYTLTKSVGAAVLSSMLLICDVAMVTLSRYILLDPIMLFFMFASVLGVVKASALQTRCSKQDKSFTSYWWGWLVFTGICLGCTLSVKLVGAFTVMFVGAWAIADLWKLLGDTEMVSLQLLGKHFAARVLCLIFLPIAIYVGVFYFHFHILHQSSDDDIFYSSKFQSTLHGNLLHKKSMPMHITFKSSLTMRNTLIEGMFLHSHPHYYPNMLEQYSQQVTGYKIRDGNNWWNIEPVIQQAKKLMDNVPLHDGDLISLHHMVTNKSLSVVIDKNDKWHAAPIFYWNSMVASISRQNSSGNDYKNWKIELKALQNRSSGICAVDCVFKLVNVAARCCLFASLKKLPGWGKDQYEISCYHGRRYEQGCWWHAEEVLPSSNAATTAIKPPSFLTNLFESHKVMFHLNSKLKKKYGDRVSKPWHWAVNYKPQLFSKKEDKLYLTGTPVVWWINATAIPTYILFYLCVAITRKRKYHLKRDQNLKIKSKSILQNNCICCNEIILNACFVGGWCLLGWCLHYLPFFAMSRVLFFHHYFPAHVFACMLSGTLLDCFCKTLTEWLHSYLKLSPLTIHQSLTVTIIGVLFHNFYLHSHFCYGST
ncbi:unnamed protein product [Clavelina lepadiformis]|uniref:Protein O-mannosyl-transferase 2 n=2 Tax=Clavelina lepadiformis TaxID=159417 RepID=A0ABP0H034_CLALP